MIPTHKVSFWGVRCYWNRHTGDLWGCNLFWDVLIEPAICFHNLMTDVTLAFLPRWEPPGFPLKVMEIYEEHLS